MRKCWTLREGLTVALAVAAAALLTRLAIQLIAPLTPSILPPLLALLLLPALCGGAMAFSPVSYTHLDVYKRQLLRPSEGRALPP